MKIIDSHAHIYPAKIAEKASNAIGKFYDIKMAFSGTTERLVNEGKEAGVSRFVVHSCATKPEQVRAINIFIKEELDKYKEFIGFMTLHQNLTEEEIDSEIKWCIENGFKGIKLHPDFQKFDIDDENAEKIYRIVGDRLPILFHTGDDRYEYSKPIKLAKMAKKYKKVRFIGAHFGAYRCWKDIDCYKGLDNVYFDTSSSLFYITKEQAKSYIENFGEDRFFFGTDYPMWTAKEEIDRLNKLDLSISTKEKIFYKNITEFLSLEK